jgi:hypothetical protein
MTLPSVVTAGDTQPLGMANTGRRTLEGPPLSHMDICPLYRHGPMSLWGELLTHHQRTQGLVGIHRCTKSGCETDLLPV